VNRLDEIEKLSIPVEVGELLLRHNARTRHCGFTDIEDPRGARVKSVSRLRDTQCAAMPLLMG
jgi:hypothetical protein